MNKFSKIILVGLLCSMFLMAGSCSALTLISPENEAIDISLNDYFQWEETPGAVKYILDISNFTQSEDNILSSFCVDGLCSFGFLQLTVGNINYLTEYKWRIISYNSAGSAIDSSSEYTFITKSSPEPPSNGSSNGGGGGPIDLKNPLDAGTLEEAINNLINFLFFLVIALAPVLIIYSAFLLITAHGDPTKITKAKKILTWVVAALVVVLLAKGIPGIVRESMGNR